METPIQIQFSYRTEGQYITNEMNVRGKIERSYLLSDFILFYGNDPSSTWNPMKWEANFRCKDNLNTMSFYKD